VPIRVAETVLKLSEPTSKGSSLVAIGSWNCKLKRKHFSFPLINKSKEQVKSLFFTSRKKDSKENPKCQFTPYPLECQVVIIRSLNFNFCSLVPRTLFRQDKKTVQEEFIFAQVEHRKLSQEELSRSSEGTHKARRAKEAEVPLSRQDKILAIKKCQK